MEGGRSAGLKIASTEGNVREKSIKNRKNQEFKDLGSKWTKNSYKSRKIQKKIAHH